MPYKSEKLRLAGLQDRRRKLTDEQVAEIRARYAAGKGRGRALADRFGVSKTTIGCVVSPAIRERKRQYVAEHWRDYRPGKEKWAETMREHRHYKQSLYERGELT